MLMLDNLISNAKDSSPATRQEFADQVSKHFADRAHLKRPEEILAFNTMLNGVYDSLDKESKQTVAARLALIDDTDPDLAFKIASDEPEIASKLLEHTHVLREGQLIRIAETKGDEHLRALARREHISQNLSRRIIERGDQRTKKMLAENAGADITPEDLERLIKSLPLELGAKIRHLRKSTEDLVRELFRDPQEVMTGPELTKRDTKIDARQWLIAIRKNHVTLNKAAAKIAFEKNLYDLASILAAIAGLERKYVANLMIRYDSTGTAVLCRALGLQDGEYAAICKARAAHLKFPESTANKWLTNYHVLDTKDAHRMLALFKAKTETAKLEATVTSKFKARASKSP